MRDPALGQAIRNNPVSLARPRAPRAYQTESSKALDDSQLRTLLGVVRGKASGGDIVARRDLAILLFFLVTGMRRSEVIGLRGGDLDLREEMLIILDGLRAEQSSTQSRQDRSRSPPSFSLRHYRPAPDDRYGQGARLCAQYDR